MSESQPHELRVYFSHLLGLVVPGRRVLTFTVHVTEPNDDVGAWAEDELFLIIDEGRRQVDRQNVDLAEIRGRAQSLLTLGLALIGLVLAGTRTIIHGGGLISFVLWVTSIISAATGVLGGTAVVVARKETGIIDTANLTHVQPPVLSSLAAAYGRVVRHGENTMATQITVYRDATTFVLAGVALYGIAWALSVT